MMSKRIQFKVQGRVQGVNFRHYTARQANKIGVTGFVQNEADGSVTGEAQGTEDGLKEMLKILKRGPSHAVVTSFEQSDIERKENEEQFRQIR